ncbi:TetR family transcriptional regulator [Rathayibacter sp. PhB93]|uniref:TetR/AcrR family transcriptional regulator n=1 Tax=unclassified Rathayibacter TaxID=2609250 RepID=UPI000F4848C7|nr:MULTISPECIES: helix-turn-helix domain-containing protein [unclassified Rathayibacter]ROQ00952.1 TetR family transcriptional regulator [Rathayibacter sp. PhB93]TDQ07306.1 TetR family transcriptional regulator [Rathayibacter sp. PhB1]
MESGRRERKKQATAVAIQRATLELVRERGLEETTVEAISDRADVTSRTFFNYFSGKEDAALGNVRSAGAHFDRGAMVARTGSALDRVRETIRDSLADTGPGEAERTCLRREAMGRCPQLIARDYRRMSDVSDELLAILEELLSVEEPSAPPTTVHLRAVTSIAVIGAAYTIAAQLWSGDITGTRTLAEHFDTAFDSIAEIASRVRAS